MVTVTDKCPVDDLQPMIAYQSKVNCWYARAPHEDEYTHVVEPVPFGGAFCTVIRKRVVSD